MHHALITIVQWIALITIVQWIVLLASEENFLNYVEENLKESKCTSDLSAWCFLAVQFLLSLIVYECIVHTHVRTHARTHARTHTFSVVPVSGLSQGWWTGCS